MFQADRVHAARHDQDDAERMQPGCRSTTELDRPHEDQDHRNVLKEILVSSNAFRKIHVDRVAVEHGNTRLASCAACFETQAERKQGKYRGI
jgi:hypothetical protein